MEVQAGPNLCTWILIFTIGFGAGYVNSEYSKDDEVWGRLPLQLINGRYEKLLVAIHETVDQDDDIIPNIMKALTSASRNMFEATKREIGVSLGEVLIAVPTHWDMPTLTGGNEGLNERVAEWYELYDKSHVRIRNYQILEDIKSFQQGEPYVLQPGSCGEEGVFIGLEPSALDANISCWGDINKTFVHLWGHFRWGLFDEYVQTEYGVAELCTAGIIFEDVMISGDSRAEVPSTNSCLRKERFYYKAKNTENTTASIMSISDADQIVDFCDSNKSDIRSLHNQDANNRHNKMCNKLSSWEIMRRHTDFANGSRQANDTIPRFTILLPRRKAIFMEDSNTCINDSNNTLDVKQRNECYLLRSTISVTTSQKIHLFHNSTRYCVYDHRRGAMGECFDYTSVDMNNDVLVFESGLSMYKNSLTSNVSSSKPILIAKEIEEGWQHEYKSTAEYITSINYDDVESNIRVEVNEFTITADTQYPWPLQLDRLLGNGKILCRIQWDSGNISIPDCEYEECFISDKLIEIRYEKFDVTNNVTIRNTDIFSITVRVELFFISAVNNALPPVVVKPFIKKCFTGSGWKIYASVTYLSKPVYNLSVNATIRGPDGASHELLLSDIPEESDDMMDGIYSNVIDVNGSGCYSVQVTVKGTNNITWNMENLQPSGVVPSECDVPLNPLNAALENADSLMRMPKELNFHVTDVTHPTAICPIDIDTDARLREGTTARVDFVASCDDNIDTGIQAACNATSQSEFPVGVTTVTCSCEDLSQNTDVCSFTVTVNDVTHPTASCPNDIDTDARLQEGTTARVDFVTSCSDNIDTGIRADCNATSGSDFPFGVTIVNCSCQDISQNTDECSFNVIVKEAVTPTGNESSSTADTKSITTESLTTEVSGHQTNEAVTATGNESSSTVDTKSMTTESLTTEVSGHQTTEAVTATGNESSSTVDTKSMTTEGLTTEVSGHQTTGNDNSSTADTKSIIDTESMTTENKTTVVAAQQTTGNNNSSTADTKSIIDTKLMITKHFITKAVAPTGNESSSTADTKSITTESLTTEVSGHQTTGNDNSSTADTQSIIDTKLMITGSITTVVAPQQTTGNDNS
ncbi:calcium-activated chloride channel regulator 4-like isoform X3 [Apostichopus japonicus]|uniref:calcium-activated chloride channel regulator 4-like isoform X3 n=1 Tax=Stichopus japonicus TaxID=307972 RepID=UPI003AB88927